jgi:hypothetical protein
MKRIVMTPLGLGACAVVVLIAGSAPAASPSADAIKGIEAVGSNPTKLNMFCDLIEQLHVAGGEEDPDVQKEIDRLITDMSPEYGAAMDLRKKLDVSSPDVGAIDAAIGTLMEKCP